MESRHTFSWRFFRMGVSRGSRSLMGGVICAVMKLPRQSHALPSCLVATNANTLGGNLLIVVYAKPA